MDTCIVNLIMLINSDDLDPFSLSQSKTQIFSYSLDLLNDTTNLDKANYRHIFVV